MSLTDKIRRLRERAGLTMEQAAKRGGWRAASSYQRYEDPNRFTQDLLPVRTAQRLIRAFTRLGNPQISEQEILALTQPSGARFHTNDRAPRVVEVIAVVEAGAFREAAEIPQDERKTLPWPPIPGYEAVEVFGLEVRGQSMNKLYPEGSFAYFVRPEDLTPQEGHIVVARAQRNDLYETTLKELRRDSRGKLALWPLSTDSNHQRPIYPEQTGAESVEIIGVVIARFELLPMPRAPRR